MIPQWIQPRRPEFGRPLPVAGLLAAVFFSLSMNNPPAISAPLPSDLDEAARTSDADGTDPPSERTVTEDVAEVLRPRRHRTESEEDLLTSGAHYAQARLFLQRGKQALALRHFQRAWRFNQDRVSLLDQIVALASKLERNEQAARYAVMSAERRPRDARLLIQLGALLGQQGDVKRALWMYEKGVELQREEKMTPQQLATRIEMGRLHFVNEDFENAATEFATVRDALEDPNVITEQQRKSLLSKPHALYSLIAASFLEAARWDEAAAMFRKANSFDENPPRLDYHLAEVALGQQAYPEARRLLDRYLDAKSTAGGIEPYRVLRTIVEHEHATPAEAKAAFLAELRRRHELDPENVPLGYFLAAELLANDQLDEAQELYVSLLERRVATDAFVSLATIYRKQNNVPKLLDIIEQVVARAESLDLLEDEVALIVENQELVSQLLDLGRERCQEGNEAVRQATGLAAAHLAIEAKQLDVFDKFVEFAVAGAGEKKVDLLQQLGLAVFVAADAKRAAHLFQQALSEQPVEKVESSLQFYLAGAAQFAGDTATAVAASTRAAELRNDSPQFASRKPWVLYQSKQYEQAKDQYLKLLEEFESRYDVPRSREVLREARMILSNIAVAQKQLPEAEEWLAQVLDEFPEDIGALNDLGYLWADQGKHLERAMKMVKRAVDADPDNVAYRDSLGWAYYRLGRFADAVRELTIATAGDEPDGVILEHLGDAYLGENQPEQAVANWQKAVSAFRKSDQVDRLSAIEAKIKKYSKD